MLTTIRPKLSITKLSLTKFCSFQAESVFTVNYTESMEKKQAENRAHEWEFVLSVLACFGPKLEFERCSDKCQLHIPEMGSGDDRQKRGSISTCCRVGILGGMDLRGIFG